MSASRTKVLFPIRESARATPIHREARDAAERALEALRDLSVEDGYVFFALLEELNAEGYVAPSKVALQRIRKRAHVRKLRAVETATPTAVATRKQEEAERARRKPLSTEIMETLARVQAVAADERRAAGGEICEGVVDQFIFRQLLEGWTFDDWSDSQVQFFIAALTSCAPVEVLEVMANTARDERQECERILAELGSTHEAEGGKVIDLMVGLKASLGIGKKDR